MVRNRTEKGAAWIWWAALILLLLRLSVAQEVDDSLLNTDEPEINSGDEGISSTTTAQPAKNAEQLGVPRCESDYDCVNNGICRKDVDGYGRCLCPLSCPGYIPMSCRYSSSSRAFSSKKDLTPCLQMDPTYRSRYSLSDPLCLKDRCVCPPMFEEINAPKKFPTKTLLPTKCDKRELQVRGFVDPAESVYKGNDVTLYCCINLDPTGVVDAGGVEFIQNTTIVRESTGHPFSEYHHDYQKNYYVPSTPCWTMEIKNVQFSDSGSYMCLVSPSSNSLPVVNHTIEFEVKAPRMIKNLNVTANATHANVTWDTEPDATLQIDLRLVRRTDYGGNPIWTSTDAKSPLTIKSLRPATPYTLFITVKDGQTDPFKLTEHFRTKESPPRPPKLEEIRILNSGNGLECEVEWRMPGITNGRIIKYFVRVQGKIRKGGQDSIITDDFPAAMDPEKCANYDQSESSERGINPVDFSSEFLSCKFGPLRPNRNYTATLWAVNAAGKSNPITYAKQCITNYAEPDEVATPSTVPPTNMTNFRLKFGQEPDDSNGPISCYYVAVVPLLHNVSLDSLPTPDTIVVDSFAKAFSNNMHTSAADKSRYFAYIAESYATFPQETVIGDGNRTHSMEPCKVLYLSRHRSEDSALRPGLKYTGFLIVRVDKDENIKEDAIDEGKYFPGHIGTHRHRGPRRHRQLHMSGPSYAFSAYFKPVYLQAQDEGGSLTTILLIIGILLVFALVGGMSVAYFTLIRGKKLSGEHIPLKMSVYGPVGAEDLPGEYRDRHKDSDFMFAQEWEKLPQHSYDACASSKKENLPKNRYNDIKSFDSTRVRLRKLDGEENSDYINANYINGYVPEKRFIAAQGPLPCTVHDFWRMCWEQNVQIIVMVANLVEKTRNQCAKYWPDHEGDPMVLQNLLIKAREPNYYGDYSVRPFDVIDVSASSSNRLSPINIPVNQSRSMSDFGETNDADFASNSEYANLPTGSSNGRVVEQPAPQNSRRIVQYHFTNWNDYRAPECSTGLLRFLHRLRELPEFNNSPVVIHCSAGVGRTGTLIAIDSMLDQYEQESKVDVFNFVSKMRKQRNLMVQSQEQYTFVYKALAEHHLFRNTDLVKSKVVDHYRQLIEARGARDRTTSFSGRYTSSVNLVGTGMEEEFKMLQEELEGRPSTKFADQPENIMKNRFPRAVPFDRNRVCLQPLIGYMESSYINASNIKGYYYPYILAQDPLDEATSFDFWRMLAEQRITFVVMLTPEEEYATSEKYWPEVESERRMFSRSSQSVTVVMKERERTSTYVKRSLEYRMKNDEKPRIVTQYSFLSWPADSPSPVSPDSLLRLLGIVLAEQGKQSETVPIVLHCRNGSSRCGMYCALSALMERLKAEDRVDVFQTVRGLRAQRGEMFTKLEEYAFCYQAVVSYLNHPSTS